MTKDSAFNHIFVLGLSLGAMGGMVILTLFESMLSQTSEAKIFSVITATVIIMGIHIYLAKKEDSKWRTGH